MRRAALSLALVTLVAGRPRPARAGGFELAEQSPTGAGTAGAQTARADDPAAVYYNPAGLAFQRGFGVLAGGNLVRNEISVATPGSPTVQGTGLVGTPTVFVSQRLGPHFAVGVGVFSSFVEHLDYPRSWAGRAGGTFFDLTTTTINPAVAIRPLPWVALGFGFAITPSSAELRHAYVAPEGTARSATTAVGLGANLGALVVAIPRYLRLGGNYRTAVDLDLEGEGVLEMAGVIEKQNVKIVLPLPHQLDFGLASTPVSGLTLSADVRATLWSDLHSLAARFTDPSKPGDAGTIDPIDVPLRDSWGVRVGAEYRAMIAGAERLRVRLGAGYDRTPVRRGWLGPLTPDNDRAIASAGLGWREGPIGIDAGYSAQVILPRTSTNPVPGAATYSGVRHVLSLAVELRLEDLGGRINVPEYKH